MNMNKARPKGEETDNNGTAEEGALRGGNSNWETNKTAGVRGLGV